MICTKCNIDREETLFMWRIKGVKKHKICTICQREYRNRHYANNKEYYIKKSSEYNNKTKDIFEEYKKKQVCEKCGDNRWYILEFHHKDPKQKESTISSMRRGHTLKSIMKEIEKCSILCANCHREEHYNGEKVLR